jgi:hypothetical protein
MSKPTLKAKAALFVLISIAIATAVILSGCAVPIPFAGNDIGKYGTINISYTPNIWAQNEKSLTK